MLRMFVEARLSSNFDNRAVTAIEYALIAALIALVIVGAVATVGKSLPDTFNRVASEL